MLLCLNNQDSYLIVINVIDYSVMSCNKSGWVSFSVTKKFFYALFTVTYRHPYSSMVLLYVFLSADA